MAEWRDADHYNINLKPMIIIIRNFGFSIILLG